MGDAGQAGGLHGAARGTMKMPHLLPALIAVTLTVAVLAVGSRHIRQLEEQNIFSLAPKIFAQKTVGIAVQEAAFRHAHA